MSRTASGALSALLAMGIYATHDVVAKVLGQYYHPAQIVFFAALLGFPMISIVLIHDRTPGTLRPVYPFWLLARTISLVLTGLFAFHAFAVLPLTQTYAIIFATPLIITVLAIPMLRETVGFHRGMAVLVGLLGVLIVLRPGAVALTFGHLSALGTALFGALTAVISRKIGRHERATVMLLYPLLGNVALTGAFLPFIYKPMPLTHLMLEAVIALLALLAAALVIRAYRLAEAVIVAPMQYSQILWATVYGWALFGEGVDRATFWGTAVIIASGLYIVMREGRAGTSATRPVLRSRLRTEIGVTPRPSLLQRLWAGGRRDDE